MDFIENLLSHMSSTFNRESMLPKQAEIAEDETFKWRALKNNQFASRSKNSQTKRINKNISSATLAEDINASNTANEIVIEIANGISNAEIQEALTQQSSSVEYQIHNVPGSYAERKENGVNSPEGNKSDKNEAVNNNTIKLQNAIAETVSTSNLFKHMSSTFNYTGEINIKNITEMSGAKQMESYGNSDSVNVIDRKAVKKQQRTIRRSSRLKQDKSKNDLSDHQEPSVAKPAQSVSNDLIFTRNIQNKELPLGTDTSTIRSESGDQQIMAQNCKKMEILGTTSKPDVRDNFKKQSKTRSTLIVNEPEAVSKTTIKEKSTKSRNTSHTKYLKIKRRLISHNKQNSRNKFDCKAMSSPKERSIRFNYEGSLNVHSKAENMLRLRGRLSRPIKLSAKILANKKLRHGFELQNNARLRCNPKTRVPSPETEHPISVSNLESSLSKTDIPEIQKFLCQIKHFTNNKSPENDSNLTKSQLQQLMKLKERHFRSLGLLSTSRKTETWKSKETPQIGQQVELQINKSVCIDAKVELEISNNEQKRGSLISSASKTKASEKCFCEKKFPYFTSKMQNRMQCTAIDDVNGQLIKCGNKLEGKVPNFLRSSMQSSYQLLCVLHYKRFRRHGCCARCGIYCTQGEFAICSRRHLFHAKCAEKCETSLRQRINTQFLLKCPHCGVKENSEKLKTKLFLMID